MTSIACFRPCAFIPRRVTAGADRRIRRGGMHDFRHYGRLLEEPSGGRKLLKSPVITTVANCAAQAAACMALRTEVLAGRGVMAWAVLAGRGVMAWAALAALMGV